MFRRYWQWLTKSLQGPPARSPFMDGEEKCQDCFQLLETMNSSGASRSVRLCNRCFVARCQGLCADCFCLLSDEQLVKDEAGMTRCQLCAEQAEIVAADSDDEPDKETYDPDQPPDMEGWGKDWTPESDLRDWFEDVLDE